MSPVLIVDSTNRTHFSGDVAVTSVVCNLFEWKFKNPDLNPTPALDIAISAG
jgi:hypothetical protein